MQVGLAKAQAELSGERRHTSSVEDAARPELRVQPTGRGAVFSLPAAEVRPTLLTLASLMHLLRPCIYLHA